VIRICLAVKSGYGYHVSFVRTNWQQVQNTSKWVEIMHGGTVNSSSSHHSVHSDDDRTTIIFPRSLYSVEALFMYRSRAVTQCMFSSVVLQSPWTTHRDHFRRRYRLMLRSYSFWCMLRRAVQIRFPGSRVSVRTTIMTPPTRPTTQ